MHVLLTQVFGWVMSAAILAAIRLSREAADAERMDVRALQVCVCVMCVWGGGVSECVDLRGASQVTHKEACVCACLNSQTLADLVQERQKGEGKP